MATYQTQVWTVLTSDSCNPITQDLDLMQRLTSTMAFLLNDLLSILNRGVIFTLIKTYWK